MEKSTLRLLDANLNRLKEGIRVVEDIFRYKYNNKNLSLRLKELRHSARLDFDTNALLNSRDIKNDVLKTSIESEKIRKNLQDILLANFKRAEESARVLEECLKLEYQAKSTDFKNLRYELYELEKLAFLSLETN